MLPPGGSDDTLLDSAPRGPGLVVAGGLWQLIGQDVPALHPLTFVLQAVHPVTEGVALRVTAQTDATFQTGNRKSTSQVTT